jgi:hypothetical protein
MPLQVVPVGMLAAEMNSRTHSPKWEKAGFYVCQILEHYRAMEAEDLEYAIGQRWLTWKFLPNAYGQRVEVHFVRKATTVIWAYYFDVQP